jgi:hypothetical protein
VSQLSHTLADAIATLRARAGSQTSRILVLVPSSIHGVLARQQLALAGPVLRVDFTTVQELLEDRGLGPTVRRGLRPEPAGWATATLRAFLRSKPESLGRFAERLTDRGWAEPLSGALATLEAEGVGSEDLAALGSEHAEVLRVVLEHLAHARAEASICSPAEVWAASLQGSSPYDDADGVVLLDGERLPVRMQTALTPWLRERPCGVLQLTEAVEGSAASLVEPVTSHALTPGHDWDLVATPDEVRECREVVRAVLQAIREGVPLDRIAIALPDSAELDTLRAHLEDARVPTRFLAGSPLSRTPAARLLSLALDLVEQPTKASWYALLRFPGLRLRRQLGSEALKGRGSWRRLIAKTRCAGSQLIPALEASLPERDEDGRARCGRLLAALRALQADLDGWKAPATLDAHAERWSDFLSRWLGKDADDLVDLLSRLEGPRVPMSLAREDLDTALSATVASPGAGASVIVADCGALLGGDFERVFLLGATEGRLPRKSGQDPLHTEALVEALAQRGFRLETPEDRRRADRRRFLAVRSATSGTLWVSSPRFEMVEGRPCLPSSLLLEEHGPTWKKLSSRTRRVGSRAWVGSPSPELATDDADWLLSLPRTQRAEHLASHPWASRLLQLHLALHRVQELDGLPCPWTGRVDPELLDLPELDGEPTSPATLGRWLPDPGANLLRRLGAWPAQSLGEGWDPTDRYTLPRLQLAALKAPHPLPQALDEALDAESRWHELGEARRELARAMLHARTAEVEQGEAVTSDDSLARFHVHGELGWLEEGALHGLVERRAKDPPADLLIQALALGVGSVTVHTPDGGARTWDTARYAPLPHFLHACLRLGWFPFYKRGLPGEPRFEPSEWPEMLGRLR